MKKILVPVDGSVPSLKAIDEALHVAEKIECEITLLSVVDNHASAQSTAAVIAEEKKYAREKLIKTVETYVNEALSKIDDEAKKDISIKKVILSGNPHDQIVKYSEQKDIELIIIGKRGLNQVKRFFLGSVTEKVVTNARCNVLVVV